MKYVDTLTLYEQLVATGVPEEQAKIQAHQNGEFGNAVNQLQRALEEFKLDIRKDMLWMRLIGAGMIITFFSNGLFMWLANK